MPAVTVARKVDVAEGKVRVERVTADGYEVVETTLPALVTVSNEAGELRYPPVKATIAAQKVQPSVWTAADVGVDLLGAVRTSLVKYYVPDHKVQCELITGGSPDEIADGIVAVLKTRVI